MVVQTVVLRCTAYGCTNRRVKGSGVKFHRFPLQIKELSAKWIAAMKRDIYSDRKQLYIYVEITLHLFYFIRNLAKGVVLKVSYF